MKLFDDFEAVRFSEENLIFITNRGFLYYIYDPRNSSWRKYRNAGNDNITVSNYQDINEKELIAAMGGAFPDKETDFSRLCPPCQLWIRDMMELLEEDYPEYMSVDAENAIYHTVHKFLLESAIYSISYMKLRMLFRDAVSLHQGEKLVLERIKKLSFVVMGKDIFKEEIGIVNGHDSSSYFWIMPVRVIVFTDTDSIDAVAEMRSVEISIEEGDVDKYLAPFLFKHLDNELEVNKKRVEMNWLDDDGNEKVIYVEGFEWYLTHNYYTFESIKEMLKEIRETMEAISSGKETEFTEQIRKKRGFVTYRSCYEINSNEGLVRGNKESEDDSSKANQIIDFYRRFINRMEYMMTVGEENGFDLISFMGP